MSGVCGRPLKKGGTCKVGTSAASLYNFGRFPDYIVWQSPACNTHLSPEEVAAREVFLAPIRQAEEAAEQAWLTADPACWSWEPTRPPEPAWLLEARERYPHIASEPYDDLTMMTEWHQGRCALCGRKPGSLVEDHDHVTAKIRGYLCRNCNTREGMGAGGPFVKYRLRPPAAILEVDEVYVDMFGREAQPSAPQ